MTFINEPELPHSDPNEVSKFYAELVTKRKLAHERFEGRCKMFEVMNESDIDAIVAGSRNRGVYQRELAELNGARLSRVSFDEGVFQGKKPDSVAIGFRNYMKGKDEYSHLTVITNKDENDVTRVYILNADAE